MKLAFKEMGAGKPLVILHGLFGSSDNWQSLGKEFAEEFRVFLVDQRNHGRSGHSDDFSYDLMAEDLSDFFAEQGLDQAIVLGHSMGGKTAMRFAQLYPEKVEKLVVADMGIKSYPPHHVEILEAFKALDLSKVDSRKDADDFMAERIPNFGVRQFILKNLYRKAPDVYGWRVNFEILEAKMEEILAPMPQVEVGVPALFIRGLKSDYILEEDYPLIREIFPRAQFAEMQAGHWLHAEDPENFYKITMDFVTN